nr:MAG: hypothetical protein [Bacteriophage sp.]
MQVIEKVKVVPEGYNGAGMNYDGCYRRNAIPNANNGTTQNQQVPTQGIWDAIDAEIAPLTQEQQNMLLNNQDYVNNYNALSKF